MDHLKKITSKSLLSILLIFIINTTNIYAETLINKNFSNFKLQLSENDTVTQLNITSSNKINIKDLFDLDNPNRIVLDINNLKLKSNKNLSINNSNEIKQIRLGKHSNKVRFVLDLKGNAVPKFSWSADNEKSLNLVINKSINLANNITKKTIPPKITPNPIINKKAVLNKNDDVDNVKSNLKFNTNKNKNNLKKLNPVKQEIKNEFDDREQGLENIKFYYKKEKKTPLVKFIMVKKPTYTLKKKDDKKYILTLENANIRWPHLELPQFPPRDFRGFTMVMPERKDGKLEITIGVERDSKVTSFTKNNEIWLKIDRY